MNLEEGAECIFVTNVFLVQGASESDWRAATILEREAWERQNMELGQETA